MIGMASCVQTIDPRLLQWPRSVRACVRVYDVVHHTLFVLFSQREVYEKYGRIASAFYSDTSKGTLILYLTNYGVAVKRASGYGQWRTAVYPEMDDGEFIHLLPWSRVTRYTFPLLFVERTKIDRLPKTAFTHESLDILDAIDDYKMFLIQRFKQ